MVKVVVAPWLTLTGVDGLIEPLGSADGVTVNVVAFVLFTEIHDWSMAATLKARLAIFSETREAPMPKI